MRWCCFERCTGEKSAVHFVRRRSFVIKGSLFFLFKLVILNAGARIRSRREVDTDDGNSNESRMVENPHLGASDMPAFCRIHGNGRGMRNEGHSTCTSRKRFPDSQSVIRDNHKPFPEQKTYGWFAQWRKGGGF